jgi:hypothetical protein
MNHIKKVNKILQKQSVFSAEYSETIVLVSWYIVFQLCIV